MTQTEMKDKFDSLYGYMAASNEPRYMKLFGEVMVEMMDWMIKNQPTAAEQWIETLCAIKWEQYLRFSKLMKCDISVAFLFQPCWLQSRSERSGSAEPSSPQA